MLVPQFRISQESVRLSAAKPVMLREVHRLPRDVQPHDHDYFECTIIVEGNGQHVTETGESLLGRGSVLVMAPEEVHGYQISQERNLRLWNIYYLAEWLMADLPFLWREPYFVDLFLAKELFPRSRRRRIPEFTLDEGGLTAVLNELSQLEAELGQAQPSLIFLKSSFLKILVQLTRGYGESHSEPEPLVFREAVWRLLQRIEEGVQRHERFDPGVEARRLGISRDHLGREFREATGYSPMEYYQERRIQMACIRLLEPAANLTEIALDLGFSDSAHFSRLFRRHRGVSPSQYRARYTEA